MTPREALYHLVMELGPIPQTKRDDNLTPKEATLRDAVNTLQDLVESREAISSLHASYEETLASLANSRGESGGS